MLGKKKKHTHMEAKNKTKQRGGGTDKNKNRNKKSSLQSATRLSDYLTNIQVKDTLGFHYQEQLFRASGYMLKNKDNYYAGNIISLTLNILCLSDRQWIVCFLLSTPPSALILALRA